jgi:hypothetical protein
MSSIVINPFAYGSPAPPAGYLFEDDLEYADAAAAAVGGWTDTGTPTWGYATAPAPLVGTKSLRVQAAAAAPRSMHTFTGQSSVWAYYVFREAVGSDNGRILASIQNSSGTDLLTIERRGADDKWLIRSPGAAADFTGNAFAAGSIYNVWINYVTNGVTSTATLGVLAFDSGNTTNLEPTSGGNFVSISGTSTTDADRIMLGQVGGNGTLDYLFDKIRIKTSSIGNNPS